MVLKGVLQRLGMSVLESDTDTETSETALDEEEQTIAEGSGKPKVLSKTPEDGPEGVATTSSSVSSPKIPSEILALSFFHTEPFDDEDSHNMAKGSRKPKATSDALVPISEPSTSNASPASSPQLAIEIPALSVESLDGEENHTKAKGNEKPEANLSAISATPETSTSNASRISSPKIDLEVPALFIESLDKDSHTTAKGKQNIYAATETSATIRMDIASTISPSKPAQISFELPALSVEPLDKDNTAMAEGEEDINDATESSAAGPQDQNNTISLATPSEMIAHNLQVSIATLSGSGSKTAVTSNKRTSPEKSKDDAERLVENHGAIRRKAGSAATGGGNLGNLKISEPGDGAPKQGVLQDNSDAGLATAAKKQNKPKPKKKKKPAAVNMTPSFSDSTVTAPATSTVNAQAKSSMTASTNPSITALTTSSIAPLADLSITALANPIRKVNLVLKNRFGFDEYCDELKCRKNECGKLTNCYDGSTVICPRCGVNSFFRYCSLECLLHPDMAFHWAQECGTCSIAEESLPLVDKSTLIIRPAAMRPYVECDARDNPARHRQAVFHSSNGGAGDYFVFNDNSLRPAGLLGHVTTIGMGQVIAVVTIVPNYGVYQGHSIFQEILEDCLRRGFSRPDKCLALVDIVTKHLVYSRQWSQEVVDCLVFQMKNEFNYEIPQEMLYRFNPMVPVSA